MALNIFYKLYYWVFLTGLDFKHLNKQQKEITEINVRKHARIFVLMLLVMAYTFYIINNYYFTKIDTVLTSLLGVLFISGTAWFAISFGAVPVKLEKFAVQITAFLFAAFAVALSAVLMAAILAVPLLSPILIIAFTALYAASVKYDITDALKLGIDEALLEHAKSGRMYFLRELKKK